MERGVTAICGPRLHGAIGRADQSRFDFAEARRGLGGWFLLWLGVASVVSVTCSCGQLCGAISAVVVSMGEC